jgi:hypothetical protein
MRLAKLETAAGDGGRLWHVVGVPWTTDDGRELSGDERSALAWQAVVSAGVEHDPDEDGVIIIWASKPGVPEYRSCFRDGPLHYRVIQRVLVDPQR